MEILTPSIVLASYAEPVLDGRRAVIFGDSTSPLAAEVLGRGARSVHVCDPEAPRAGESAARNRSRQISIVPLGDADVAVREGAFDVAIVEDLSSANDASALLKQVRRALSPRGVAFVASPNPDVKRPLLPRTRGANTSSALGYYELYDKVAAEFQDVRMLGQTPFVGYAVVDFAPAGELDVELDSDFLPSGAEEPEWFIAVAARETTELGVFSIVQLPASRVVGAGTDDQLAEELRGAHARLASLDEKLGVLTAENTKLAAERRSKKSESNARAEELAADLEKKNARVVDLESAKAALDAALKQSTDELESLRSRVAEAERAKEERDAAVVERDRLQAKLRETEAPPDAESEIARMEGLLTERADRIRALEGELQETERIGKELVKELAREVEARSARPDTEQTGVAAERAEALMAENARLSADLQAAEWTVQELENRLDRALRRPTDATHPAPVGEGSGAKPDKVQPDTEVSR
jgi:hypothetical protein